MRLLATPAFVNVNELYRTTTAFTTVTSRNQSAPFNDDIFSKLLYCRQLIGKLRQMNACFKKIEWSRIDAEISDIAHVRLNTE